mgnify:CR=1 FL=1
MMKSKLLIIALFWALNFSAQRYILDSILPFHGRVIHQEENQLQFALESPYFNSFFKKCHPFFCIFAIRKIRITWQDLKLSYRKWAKVLLKQL